MTIDGFVTPDKDFDAYLGDISYEGDQYLPGDSVTLNGHALTEPRIGGTTNYYASTVTATTSPSKPDGTPILDVRQARPELRGQPVLRLQGRRLRRRQRDRQGLDLGDDRHVHGR